MSKISVQNNRCDQVLKTMEVSSGCDFLFPRMRTISDMNGWFVCYCPHLFIFMWHHWFSSKESSLICSLKSVYLRDSLILVSQSYIWFGLNFWKIAHISVFDFKYCLFYNQSSEGLRVQWQFFCMDIHNMSSKPKQILSDGSLMTVSSVKE